MILNTWCEEEVNGVVIGAYRVIGRLFCNGRPQGQTISAESEQELKDKANEYVAQRKLELGEFLFKEIFPGDWELRIVD